MRLAFCRRNTVYRLIVPSSEKKGAGQGATGRGWHSPLVDPTSVGGEAAAANAKLLEPLLLHLEDEEKFRREAKRLIPAIDTATVRPRLSIACLRT